MKAIFLTRFDFTENKKDGGLLGAYRNYELLEHAYGTGNIMLCIISSKKKEDHGNIKYFFSPDDIVYNYLTYFFLKDRLGSRVEREIIRYINECCPDLIFYDGSTYGQLVNKIENVKKQIVYFHNIERQYTWDQVRKHSWLCIFRYIATRFNERKMAETVKNRICVNERDAKLLENYYGKKCNFILPATFTDRCKGMELNPIKKEMPSGKDELQLLFVGSYFAHNYTGLKWFIKEVLPFIKCTLTIVGKNMEKMQKELKKIFNEKIIIKGTVENLEEYYIASDAVVMPIFMGGGIKVKTAEAMMYGKTIFASPEALQGYETQGIDNIFRCGSGEEFINTINNYCIGKSRRRYNPEIRRLFLEQYDTEAIQAKFQTYLQKVE